MFPVLDHLICTYADETQPESRIMRVGNVSAVIFALMIVIAGRVSANTFKEMCSALVSGAAVNPVELQGAVSVDDIRTDCRHMSDIQVSRESFAAAMRSTARVHGEHAVPPHLIRKDLYHHSN